MGFLCDSLDGIMHKGTPLPIIFKVETQQPQALLLAQCINLAVTLPLLCRRLAVHAASAMLPPVHFCCYLPLGKPHIKWVLHAC